MKNIQNYAAQKYNNSTKYTSVADDVYECNGKFFTSLSFEQEPELGEGTSPADISQYPLEDVLERYLVFVSDFYEDINKSSGERCFLEFASRRLNDVRNLRTLIGRRAYNQQVTIDGECYNELIIE